MRVIRYETADAFLAVALPTLMLAEAENNLILGVAQGIARSPEAARNPYLAAVVEDGRVLACGVHLAPLKIVITRANRDPIAALAEDAFAAIPGLIGVSGPSRSAYDFGLAWNQLSGVEPRPGMRLRIHEARSVAHSNAPGPPGTLRRATAADHDLLTAWTIAFVAETRIPETVDASKLVSDSIRRERLYVWENGQPVSMAAWTGKTPSGVRINLVYTPRALRGRGYSTACVGALTKHQLEQGNTFCWLYTNLSGAATSNIFRRIGYRPVSDVAEYYLGQEADEGSRRRDPRD